MQALEPAAEPVIDLRSVTPRGASRLVLHSIGDRTAHVASPIAFAPVHRLNGAAFASVLEEKDEERVDGIGGCSARHCR